MLPKLQATSTPNKQTNKSSGRAGAAGGEGEEMWLLVPNELHDLGQSQSFSGLGLVK